MRDLLGALFVNLLFACVPVTHDESGIGSREEPKAEQFAVPPLKNIAVIDVPVDERSPLFERHVASAKILGLLRLL
jgi:hypothetical protein